MEPSTSSGSVSASRGSDAIDTDDAIDTGRVDVDDWVMSELVVFMPDDRGIGSLSLSHVTPR